MRRAFIAVLGLCGLCALLASSSVEEPAPPAAPVAAPAPVAKPPPPPPPPKPAPVTKISNSEGCERKSQCASGHCCFTLVGSICAASCTFSATGMPGAEDRCESQSDCARAQQCVVRATVGSTTYKVCE